MRPWIGFAVATVLALAAAVASAPTHESRRHELAREALGDVERRELPDAVAYASGTQALLFFETRGVVGPIEGFVRVHEAEAADLAGEGGRAERAESRTARLLVIDEVVLLRSREGVDHDALDAEHLAQYVGRRGGAPIVVDAVTGATISSRALGDAVHRSVREYSRWIRARDARRGAPSAAGGEGGGGRA